MARKRALNRLPDGRQRLLSLGADASAAPAAAPDLPPEQADRFVPEQVVWLGNQALPDYLKERGLKLPLILKDLLSELDYSKLGDCKEKGRKPIHPRVFIGLIVYGLLNGRTSLRQLEDMARADLGAMHLCGGLQPDHSTIGRFIAERQDELSSDFFVEVTQTLAKKLPRSGKAAIDGTIVQAAASSYRTLRLEAAREHAAELAQEAAKDPANKALQKTAERASQAVQAAEERTAKREQKGKDASKLSVSPTEPEAAVQMQKRGGVAPSYKPSIIANDQGLICAQAIHPTSETEVLSDLLEQHEKVTGSTPETLLADAGYSTEKVYEEALKRDIDLLVPAGKETAKGMKPTSRSGDLVKQDFVYDPATDSYRCPAGKSLFRMDKGKDSGSREYTRYRAHASDCRSCPLKERCTDSSGGRRIKRYLIDEQKEAMARILEHPLARTIYAQRKVIVETPWAVLKEKQRLRRFRRFGLKGAGVEFALHSLAFNLGLVARRALGAAFALFVALWGPSSRQQGSPSASRLPISSAFLRLVRREAQLPAALF